MSNLPQHSVRESIGHEDRGTAVITAYNLDTSDDENHIPLVDLIEELNAVLNAIPEEFRASATLNIKAYGDYASAYADVTWERPETDEELADRRRWLKSIDDEHEQRDKREFERLSRKYDGASR